MRKYKVHTVLTLSDVKYKVLNLFIDNVALI